MRKISLHEPGFSFIEIIVALLVSSFLSLVLYNSLSNTQRSTKQVNQLIEETADLVPFMTQFEKDLSGAFAPMMDMVATSTQPSHKASAGEPQKKPQKIFHATAKSGSLSELTFVTTNALAIPGEAVPRVVQVTYKLVPQADTAGRFELTRAEKPYEAKQTEGDQEKKIAGRGFVLMRNIKKFVAHYSGLEIKQLEKTDVQALKPTQSVVGQEKKTSTDAEKKQKKLVRLQEWGTAPAQEKTKQKLPVLVELEATFVPAENREFVVSYLFFIPAGNCIEDKSKESKKSPQESEKTQDAKKIEADKKSAGQQQADKKQTAGRATIFMGGTR